MKTVRLTMAQALVRYLMAQKTEIDGDVVPLFPGVLAIFGHGNVTCLSEALEAVKDDFPTWRGQNEQSMALAAVGFAKAKKRRLGDPLDESSEQGPQVSQEQMDKILGYCDKGKKEGAELVTGGKRHGQKGFFVEPTVFNNVDDDMAIARDEIFGPVVSVLPFSDVDEMIERANNTFYGLASGVFTKNIDKAHLFAKHVKAGTVWVNCYHVIDGPTPFGGFKQSGTGREFGTAAIELYTELKTVTIKLG